MEQAIKHKAVSGMLWTGFERLGTQLIQFVISVFIARILLPDDYGLIGMLVIFMGIAQTFIDSGFANALIQKKDPNQDDFSTVFYFSIATAALFYCILFFSAPFIAEFYHQPLLTQVTRVYMLTLLINGLSISQTAKLTIDLDFRTQAIISIASIFISGSIGIFLAYSGYGVWALVWQGLSMSMTRTVSTWIASRWMPLWSFSIESFKKLFSFGGKLLVSSLINNIYSNISTLIIGKAYQSTDLGFYTR
ncbi:MAG: lipopolysaccharide biosynthesis protein, partial [Muribaculaceae bacterium]|nr:lipopolysaccharide biosynthesis protein [Muribaculaceae bacterium]